jgi:hypothetical protein
MPKELDLSFLDKPSAAPVLQEVAPVLQEVAPVVQPELSAPSPELQELDISFLSQGVDETPTEDIGLIESITGKQRIEDRPELGTLPEFNVTPEGDTFKLHSIQKLNVTSLKRQYQKQNSKTLMVQQ